MKEIRICEIRADAAAGVEQALRLEGRPIVYDQPTKINDPAGAFIEVIRAGALEGADLSDASSFKKGLIDYRAMAIADCKPIVPEAFVKLTRAAS